MKNLGYRSKNITEWDVPNNSMNKDVRKLAPVMQDISSQVYDFDSQSAIDCYKWQVLMQAIITQRSDLYWWKNTEIIVYSLQRNLLWRDRTLWQGVFN